MCRQGDPSDPRVEALSDSLSASWVYLVLSSWPQQGEKAFILVLESVMIFLSLFCMSRRKKRTIHSRKDSATSLMWGGDGTKAVVHIHLRLLHHSNTAPSRLSNSNRVQGGTEAQWSARRPHRKTQLNSFCVESACSSPCLCGFPPKMLAFSYTPMTWRKL